MQLRNTSCLSVTSQLLILTLLFVEMRAQCPQRQPRLALSHPNGVLLTLMKLRLDCPNEDLAQRFGISTGMF